MNSKRVFKVTAIWSAAVLGCVVLAALVYVAPFFLLTPEPPGQPSAIETMDDLDRYFANMVGQQLPPALDITVLKEGRTVFSKAYGVADGISGETANAATVYHYWSMTKTFTSVAIFQLVESGLISLDAPLTDYLPYYEVNDKAGKPVQLTIGHLLSHGSGLSDFFVEMYDWIHEVDEPRVGDTEVAHRLWPKYSELSWPPGSKREYANINYVLLGAVIEAVTGGSYEDYVRQEILQPLELQNTDFVYRPDMLDHAARGSQTHWSFYTLLVNWIGSAGGMDAITEKRVGDRHWLELVYTDYNASTSLIGNGLDLGRFGQMLLNHGELDGVRLLSGEHARMVLNGGRLDEDMAAVMSGQKEPALGFGTKTWVDRGVDLIGHGGGGPGFALQYLLVPDKDLVIVVLANSSMNDSFELAKLIASVF